MKAEIICKEIAFGKNTYRLSPLGNWSVLMCGSFPFQNERGLTWRWVSIAKDKVPKEVLSEARRGARC